MRSRSVRIDEPTHDQLTRLANEMNVSVAIVVSLGVRTLRQERIAVALRAPLRSDEIAWLGAQLG